VVPLGHFESCHARCCAAAWRCRAIAALRWRSVDHAAMVMANHAATVTTTPIINSQNKTLVTACTLRTLRVVTRRRALIDGVVYNLPPALRCRVPPGQGAIRVRRALRRHDGSTALIAIGGTCAACGLVAAVADAIWARSTTDSPDHHANTASAARTGDVRAANTYAVAVRACA
jgi:hypothetical protein